MTTQNQHFSSDIFNCIICDYTTCRKSQYDRHILTRKHIKNNADNGIWFNKKYECEKCEKKFKDRAGLWRHKKKCDVNCDINKENNSGDLQTITPNNKMDEEIKELKNMFMKMIEINQDLQNQLFELSKEKTIINNTTNNTTNNNKFNMNIFLNEKCKDAPNLIDFINSIHLKLTDFENFGTFGYADNISRILLREIKDVDIYKRPIHCSDLKREVIHVKDDNSWKKDEDKRHMKKAIKEIAYKNFKTIIPEWVKANPDSKDTTTKKHDQYIKMMNNSMGEITEEGDEKNYNKIIRTVAKEILVDKEK